MRVRVVAQLFYNLTGRFFMRALNLFVSENQTFNSLFEGSYVKEISLYVQVIFTSIC